MILTILVNNMILAKLTILLSAESFEEQLNSDDYGECSQSGDSDEFGDSRESGDCGESRKYGVISVSDDDNDDTEMVMMMEDC